MIIKAARIEVRDEGVVQGKARAMDFVGPGVTVSVAGGVATVTIPGVNSGTATIDFGAFPGASDTSLAIIGQTGILAGSEVQAWLFPATTADHSADEHLVETLKVLAGNIVAGTGFTIYGLNTSQFNEPALPGGLGTRIYGTWSVAWLWM